MRHCFAILLVAFAPFFARAGGDEVVVVYNKNMPGSKGVADYYARMRDVPAQQVYGFSLTTNEVMSREDFRDLLQLPLAARLEASGLWKFGKVTMPGNVASPLVFRGVVAAKVRYAVLCYGVPLKIADAPDLDEPENPAVPLLFQNNGASVDSELAWLPRIEAKLRLDGPMYNWVYGVTNIALLNPTNGLLMVARLDGPSPEIAMGLVRKSLQAEQDGLWGRTYFDARGIQNPPYKIGDDWILDGAAICRDLGFDPVVDTNEATFSADFPMSQIAIYAGWYSGNVVGPFAQPTVEFMPGAFAYHLHSYSAATLRSTTENWCGPLLAKGAACTMGCVDEPSVQFTPNVGYFLRRWIFGQFTYGEAAWAAQPALSWQTTVVGDPLYRPFNKDPKQILSEFTETGNPLIEWYYWRLVNAALVRGVSYSTLENFLENLPEAEKSAVLTEKLADLCDAGGKPDAAIECYQRALELNPSPEERIRIRLVLGQDLVAQNRPAGAIEDYQALLKEAPAYPGDDLISEKIAGLEQKIDSTK